MLKESWYHWNDMRTDEVARGQRREGMFIVILYLALFGVPAFIPGKYGGAIAMLAISIIGLPVHIVLFRERRGWLKLFVSFAAAAAIAAGAAIGLLILLRGHWP
jgi:hypothetical protein